jgi:hypothetical protein
MGYVGREFWVCFAKLIFIVIIFAFKSLDTDQFVRL